MIPYYDEDGITIYHADCLEIMSDIAADVIITDPPYGIGLDANSSARWADGKKRTGHRLHASVIGDDSPFDPSPFLHLPCLFTGAEHFANSLPVGRFHCWDKTGGGIGSTGFVNEFELIWTSFPSGRSQVFRILWAGLHRVNSHPDSFQHPTQKPVELFRTLIEMSPGGVILDPFMGSGTTLRAAKDLGRRAIGIEISEQYCEIAVKRLAQGVLF